MFNTVVGFDLDGQRGRISNNVVWSLMCTPNFTLMNGELNGYWCDWFWCMRICHVVSQDAISIFAVNLRRPQGLSPKMSKLSILNRNLVGRCKFAWFSLLLFSEYHAPDLGRLQLRVSNRTTHGMRIRTVVSSSRDVTSVIQFTTQPLCSIVKPLSPCICLFSASPFSGHTLRPRRSP